MLAPIAENIEASLQPSPGNSLETTHFDYHLKEPEAVSDAPTQTLQPLSLLQNQLSTESEQLQKKRILAGTIAGCILVSVILLRIAGELLKEYTRQKKEDEKTQEVEWNEGKKRAKDMLVRPASERKDANDSDDEIPDELASMH